MPICRYHRYVWSLAEGEECPKCIEDNIIVISSEFDKQDRYIDGMRYQGHEFNPHLSRAILVFEREKK